MTNDANRPPRQRSTAIRRVAGGVLAGLALAAVPAVPPASARVTTPPPAAAIRLVAGTRPMVDASGAVWSPDQRFADGGSTWRSTVPIAGTTNDKIFQSERWGVRGYQVPVPASGRYRVSLNVSELVLRRAGQRVFSVDAEGRRVATGVDIVRRVGFRTAYVISFVTTVTDGVLDLAFGRQADYAKVSSLSIQPVTASDVVARVVAGPTAARDAAGRVWSPDVRYAVGGNAWRTTVPIAGTTSDDVFRPERWAVQGYQIPVPARGYYRVTLNEAEVSFTAAGRRVFDVVAEDRTVLRDVDVAKDVGVNHAWTATFTVPVTDGSLTLLLPAKVNHAKVSSLVVQRVARAEPTTRPRPAAVVPAPPATPAAPAAAGPASPGAGTPSPALAAPAPAPAVPAGPASIFGTALTMDPTSPRGGGFGQASIWRTTVRDAPLAENSAAMVANLSAQVQRYYGGNAAFNVWQYGGNVFTVGAEQARVDLTWDDCQHKGYVPRGLFGPGGQFVSVPVPSSGAGSVGNDSSISIYQPSTDTLWSYWKLNRQADGWHACWGGRIDGVSTSPGYFLNGFGTTATGLAGEGGMVNIRDVQAGSIDHALTLSLVSPATWKTVSWPAQRSDGGDLDPDAVPEGTRLKLDPTVDVDALALHPIARMIAKAAQTYGFIVSDKAGAVGVAAEGGTPVQSYGGSNPWPALMKGTPSYGIMAGFPWSRLQALPKDYGRP